MYCDLRMQPCTLWEQSDAIMIDVVTKKTLDIEETAPKALGSSHKPHQPYRNIETLDTPTLNFCLKLRSLCSNGRYLKK